MPDLSASGSPSNFRESISVCTREVQDMHHPHSLGLSLFSLQQCGTLCDVKLLSGDQDIHVHRVVLAACSQYFRAMFTGGLSESYKAEVNLKNVDFEALRSLIHYAYTGIIVLDDMNVQTLLETADVLQFHSAKSLCCDFITDQLNLHNCLEVFQFADQFNCKEMRTAAQLIFNRNWRLISRQDSFRVLSLDTLRQLISSDDIDVDSEVEIFELIVSWVSADVEARIYFLPELIPIIRWPFVHPVFAKRIFEHPLIIQASQETQASLQRHVSLTFCASPLPMRSKYQSWLYVLGGEQSFLKEMHSCEFFNHEKGDWDYGFSLNGPRTSFAAVAQGGKLHVIGGMRFGGKLKVVECFYQNACVWKRCASLKKCQGDVEAAVINDVVFVAGGSSDGEPACRYVERFDESNNQWHAVSSMKARRRRFALVEYKSKLYAFGGFDDSTGELQSVESYDPDCNRWEFLSSMLVGRCDFAATVLSDFIYVCGGVSLSKGSMNSVERYDPKHDTWTSCAPLNLGRGGHAVVSYFGRIVVIGGMNSYMQTCRDAEWYDEVRNEWSVMPVTMLPRFGCVAVTLPFCRLPACFVGSLT